MKPHILLPLALMCMAVTSCETELDINADISRQLCVFALATPGQELEVYVSNTQGIEDAKYISQKFSLDTYKSAVAKAGLSAGADLINDIWGLKYDPDMARVIAEAKAPSCLMHNRKAQDYREFFPDMLDDLRETLTIAEEAGIARDTIILDPGVGFAKSLENNLECVRRLPELIAAFNLPVLLGTSRKSMIGLTLNLPADQRVEGTVATSVMAAMAGCMFVRVHDVQANARAVKMTEAICHGK